MTMPRFSRLVVTTTLLFGLTALGCGRSDQPKGPTGILRGKVALDGKPVMTGTVNVFSSDNQRVGSGPITPSGNYEVSNAPVGPVKLAVVVPDLPAAMTVGHSPRRPGERDPEL